MTTLTITANDADQTLINYLKKYLKHYHCQKFIVYLEQKNQS